MSYETDPILRKILYLFDRTLFKEDNLKDDDCCRGFSRFDYEILCSISRAFLKYGKISDRQHEVLVNRLYKYRAHKIPETWSVQKFIEANRPSDTLPKGVCLLD